VSTATELLLVALLLGMWLLLRVRRAEESRQPMRRQPTDARELGLVLFEVLRGQNLHAWRGMFLDGREAAEALGSEAEAYLERRTARRLEAALKAIGARVPAAARLEGLEVLGDTAVLRLSLEGAAYGVPIGNTTRVGRVIRLVEVANEWE
jgi:hypothetical protein